MANILPDGNARLRRYLPPVRVDFWRPLVLAVVAVVVSFVLTLWYSHYRMTQIEHYADEIAFNAEPSLARLGQARALLQRIAVAADLYSESRMSKDPEPARRSRDDVLATRREIGEQLEQYRALPSFPGEAAVAGEIGPALRLLDERLAVIFTAEPSPETMFANEHRVYEAVFSLDGVLQRLSEINNGFTVRDGEAILRARRRGALLALALGAISVGLALVASVLALLAMRGQSQLVEEHNRFLEDRAGELELFARRVAHDLQNPLAAMSLRVALAKEQPAPEARETIDKLGQTVRSMNAVVEDLLAFAIGGARVQPGASTELAKVIDQVVLECRASSERAGIVLEMESGEPLMAACSHGALTSVVSNLLRNAVKFVGAVESPRVTVRWRRAGERVRVEVDDNGPGIPEGSETRLFVPFVRLHQTTQPGLGLGLATVKRIVEAHGGRVGVERRQPGTRFWFELPLAQPPSPAV
jgi:signal transduction histidine kinase